MLTRQKPCSPMAFLHIILIALQLHHGATFLSNTLSIRSSFSKQRMLLTERSAIAAPQLIQFREPQTNVTVYLVGAMHYNPTSIALAYDTVNRLGRENALGSVLIESCDLRFNKTADMESEKKASTEFLKKILKNEMKTAADAAMEFQRPVVLGDQRINITTTRMGDAFKQTMVDLVTPWNGGWSRFYTEIKEAAEVALPSGAGYIGVRGFLDPRLLLMTPVSLVKYPLSFLVRDPLATTAVFSVLAALNGLADATSSTDGAFNLGEIVGSLGVSALETAVFGRVLIKTLLAERNEILARNILYQCQLYAKQGRKGTERGMFGGLRLPNFLWGKKKDERVSSLELDGEEPSMWYIPGSVSLMDETNQAMQDSSGNEKAVVAVLGMAHCNGILKLLKEKKL